MIVWEDIYDTGIELIDGQHVKFVETLNQLYDAVEKHQGAQSINQVFESLANYGKYHFATEEKYFDEFNYEGAVEHKAKHKEFKQKIADYQSKIQNGQMEVTNELTEFLEDWLTDHVMTLDKKYIQCFKDGGLK